VHGRDTGTKVPLESVEIRSPCGGRHDHLAIDDRPIRLKLPCGERDIVEPIGPIVAATGEQLHLAFAHMSLKAIPVVFDLVNPQIATGRLWMQGGE
jgi:hypothetical protein